MKIFSKNLPQKPITYTKTSINPAFRNQYKVGDYTYGRPEILASDAWPCTVEIGKFCSIANGVKIVLDQNHRLDWVTTYPFPINADFPEAAEICGHPYANGDVTIGNDVWIGFDAVILSGITIGDGAVIGARSVVSKNVPPYAVVGGSPAKHIKYRFSKDIIAALLAIGWWNWPIEKIRENARFLCSSNISGFIAACR
jgi:acetyltransferase-like isoleucine patch superfamily enzyme